MSTEPTINARIEALASPSTPGVSWREAARIVGGGIPWHHPMVWTARRAVPGPWTWLSATPAADTVARELHQQNWPGDDWTTLSANARNAWRRAASEWTQNNPAAA